MNKKVLYGVIAVVLLLLIAGGVLATTYAQSTKGEELSIQGIRVPLGFKMGNWFKCKFWFKNLIQVSPEYNETIMNILKSNGDAKNLLDQGYAIASIRPVLRAYVESDGVVTFKAEKAIVVLSNGNTMVIYLVDIVSKSVTHIMTINVSAMKELSGHRVRGL